MYTRYKVNEDTSNGFNSVQSENKNMCIVQFQSTSIYRIYVRQCFITGKQSFEYFIDFTALYAYKFYHGESIR